jgi:hypothetical protein
MKTQVQVCWKIYGNVGTVFKSKILTEQEAIQFYKTELEEICTCAWLRTKHRVIYKWLKRPGSL